jgi:predicted transposase YdaD
VNDAPIAPESRALLSQVLEFWFIERFRDLSAKEIWAMLNALTPLEETHAYQSIYAEGTTEGKAEGKSDALERLLAHRFGPLPGWASTRITAASIDQLDAWLDGIFDAESLEALIGSKTQC